MQWAGKDGYARETTIKYNTIGGQSNLHNVHLAVAASKWLLQKYHSD